MSDFLHWIEPHRVLSSMGIICTLFLTTWAVIVVGWGMRRSLTADQGPRARYVGWLTYVFSMMGWCVWGPSAAALLNEPALAILTMPAGVVLGVLVGYVIGRLTAVFFFSETDDEGPHDDDAPDG